MSDLISDIGRICADCGHVLPSLSFTALYKSVRTVVDSTSPNTKEAQLVGDIMLSVYALRLAYGFCTCPRRYE